MMNEEQRIIRAANLSKGFFEGSWNSMNRGQTFKNPSFLFRQKYSTRSALSDSDATIMHLERVISLNHNLPIDKEWAYKMKNEPSVYIYYINKSDDLIRAEWQFSKNKRGWIEIEKKKL